MSSGHFSSALGMARSYGPQVLIFGANFAVAKALAFLSPLLLAKFLSPAMYGNIEFAWSVGGFAGAVLGAGVPAAVPQLSLLRRSVPMVDVLAASVAVPACLSLLLGLAGWLVWENTAAWLLAGAIALALTQTALSNYTRTFSMRNWAVWMDGVTVLSVPLLVLALVAVGPLTVSRLSFGLALLGALAIAIAAMVAWLRREPDFTARLRTAAAVGSPLLAYSLCSIWSMVGPRILLGWTLGAKDVALYSADFRVASVCLVVHAVLATALFAQIFRMHARLFDRLVSGYLLGVAAFGIALIFVFPHVLFYAGFRAIAPEDIGAAVALFPCVMLTVFMIQAWALLESRLNRSRRASQAAWRTAVLLTVTAAILWILSRQGILTLTVAVWILAAQMVGGVAIQLIVLWRRGLKLVRIIRSIMLATAATVLIAVLKA